MPLTKEMFKGHWLSSRLNNINSNDIWRSNSSRFKSRAYSGKWRGKSRASQFIGSLWLFSQDSLVMLKIPSGKTRRFTRAWIWMYKINSTKANGMLTCKGTNQASTSSSNDSLRQLKVSKTGRLIVSAQRQWYFSSRSCRCACAKCQPLR